MCGIYLPLLKFTQLILNFHTFCYPFRPFS